MWPKTQNLGHRVINNMAIYTCAFILDVMSVEIWGGGRPVFVSPSLFENVSTPLCLSHAPWVWRHGHVLSPRALPYGALPHGIRAISPSHLVWAVCGISLVLPASKHQPACGTPALCARAIHSLVAYVSQSIHVKLTLLTAQIWVNYP